ncbi:LytTR family DNA-binding domain-containing protein [Algoriphagus sp. AK58]|uniref:LytR/AlgR family response regulator transcription factor n=1 Tax=Algoriphagus sp. AK58 TaxID=1406877 RepID=UPI00164F3BE6|nr:LytTR family DNA-binding domain-containing protein [Algoriphagus sp. AK58]MBC6366215.1 hypothetical protein [Algoriphagus sp. AK58]
MIRAIAIDDESFALEVIKSTAYSDYAVKGFELDALDYLLKPFNLSRFLKACQKAQEWIDLRPKNEPLFLFVKTSEGQIRVDFSDLLYCEAQGNYVTFQLEKEKIISRMTLAETEKQLPSYFIRTHRSFLANRNHISRVERHQLWLKGFQVPISSSYSDQVRDYLQA